MQRILIDTSTAAPEAMAIIMALNEPSIQVDAISTVMGKVPALTATRNTLLGVAAAGTYRPPVFEGMAKPMFREHRDASLIYGADGLGNLKITEEPAQTKAQRHAVDGIIEAVRQADGELETLCLGPLTNLALAVTKAPEIMRKLQRITLMGGAAFEGNAGPTAEFNIRQDAEAADIVFSFGVPLVMVTWETANGNTVLNQEDMEQMAKIGNRKSVLCLDCCKALQRRGDKLPVANSWMVDAPIAFAVMARPELVLESFECYSRVETQGGEQVYGTTVNDRRTDETHPFRANASETIGAFNCRVVHRVDGAAFKKYLFDLLVK